MAEHSLSLRRLRQSRLVRQLVREHRVGVERMIQPHFVVEGISSREEVPGLTGTYRETPESLLKQVEQDIRAGADFQMSVPRPLFLARIQTADTARNRFSANGDLQRFLIVAPPGRDAMIPTTVVLNWSAELSR